MEGLTARGSGAGAGCGQLHNHYVTGGRVREIYTASGGTVACGGHNANTMHTFLRRPHARLLLLKNLIRDQRHRSVPPLCSSSHCVTLCVLFILFCFYVS